MKKSEFIKLTEIIKRLVSREIQKQLPLLISEIMENPNHKSNDQIIHEKVSPQDDSLDFKSSLRELFSGTPVIKNSQETPVKEGIQLKHYTNNSKINQILNETVSDLIDRERFIGAAAFQGGYSPSLNMIPGFNSSKACSIDNDSKELEFTKNIPVMPSLHSPVISPISITEGMEVESMSGLPQGSSVLDIARHISIPSVSRALTRNYSQMMKLIDKKKGKI